jgi:hypothetical protein
MKATTVKIGEEILNEIKPLLDKKQTLTAFVKESVQNEIKRKKMKNSAIYYMKSLKERRSEAEELNEWESANLAPVIDHEVK